MSSFQSMLVIGSIFLLTMLILTFYRANNEQMSSSVENEAMIASTGIAQSILDEIQSRAFDEFTVSNYTDVTDSLTTANSLGPEFGESNVNLFDDIDDFNGYTTVDSSTRLGSYDINIDVYYIVNFAPGTPTASRTFVKQIDVNVYNTYMKDTLTLSHIIGY